MAIEAYGRDPEELAFSLLFPFTSEFKKIQAMTEISPRARGTLSVLDVLRKEWGSSTIRSYMESNNIIGMALDRKARLEATEIVAAGRMGDLKAQSEY